MSANKVPPPPSSNKETPDDQYLAEYGQIFDHIGMLQDHQRMAAYHDAIKLNADAHFKDKIVLDVGSGTGVLAIWAAEAGAAHVYAAEASAVVPHLETLVAAHGLGHKITVLRGRIEDQQLDGVDVILSEWMGYFLLRESMVQSVLIARDRWLRPGGVMYPSHARLLLAPASVADFARRQRAEMTRALVGYDALAAELAGNYGLKFEALRESYTKEQFTYFFREAWQGHLPAREILGDAQTLLDVDMHTVTMAELFGWTVTGVQLPLRPGQVAHGLCGWFDVRFSGRGDQPAEHCVELDTAPTARPTHWAQTTLLLDTPMDGTEELTVSLRQNEKFHHDINVTIACAKWTASYAITADFRGFYDGTNGHDGGGGLDESED